MAMIRNTLLEFWRNFSGTISTFSLVDVFDILAVALIVYYGLKLVRETRAIQLVKSIGIIFAIYFISELPFFNYSMIALNFLIGTILDSGLVVLAVLFQPEIRRALERIGRGKISDIGIFQGADGKEEQTRELIETLCKSCEALSASRTGALIVIERDIKLGDIVATGTVIDAAPCEAIISSIFFKNSPLHDGAMVIRDSRIHAAGCLLPLSANGEIARELGTRHRAALGMSEVSDAVILVVSEETGSISAAVDSRIRRELSVNSLRKLLTLQLTHPPQENKRIRLGKKSDTKESEESGQNTPLN